MPDATSVVATRIAICELTARYNRLFDQGDGHAWAATFVPDGELVVVDNSTYVGRDELAGFCHERAGQFHHLSTNPEIQVTGDEALQRCSLLLLATSGGQMEVVAAGRYVDELSRGETGWLFRRRTVTMTRSAQRSSA